MKILFLSILLVAGQLSAADKVYAIKKNSPEIVIGEESESAKNMNEAFDLWYVAMVRSDLGYDLPSVTPNTPSFSPLAVGFLLGKKTANQFFLHKGYYEISAEWQRFERESAVLGSLLYSQKLDLYQLNFFQNFNIPWALNNQLFFSAGLGLAPLYFAAPQSVFGNSTSELGYMGMLKVNMAIPLKKWTSKTYEIDVGLRTGLGKVGSQKISTNALSLGLNFE